MDLSARLLSVMGLLFINLSTHAQMEVAVENSFSNIGNDTATEDVTPPRTDLLRSDVGDFIYGPATRIKFKIIEKESGLQTTFFKIADLPFMRSDGRQMMPHDLEDGSYQMRYYSVDNQGNQEQVRSASIYIDKHGPKVSSSFNMPPATFVDGVPVFSKDVKLMLEVADEKVDVQRVTYQINDGEKVRSEDLYSIDLTNELKEIEDGSVKIVVIAYDYFFNMSKEVIEFKISR